MSPWQTTPRGIGFPPEGIHSVDWGTYDEVTNRVICWVCKQVLDANAWARPCRGTENTDECSSGERTV